MYKENHLQKFKELIGKLSKKLNTNGNIVVGYLYDIENEDDSRDIYKQQIKNGIFTEPEYSYYYFRKMHDLHCDRKTDNHDACLVYMKK